MQKKTVQQTLTVSVPKPCSENWDAMETRDSGRYCNSCRKTVVDFSGLTDAELHAYLSTAKEIPCGRFYNSQLNTRLEPMASRRKHRITLYKPLAALLTLLSLNDTETFAQGTPTIQQPVPKKDGSKGLPSKAVISGSVKDVNGFAIESAEIIFDGKPVATSDTTGMFQFEVTPESASKTSLLTVIHPGMTKVVRSYHPAMQSTSFSIVLEKPREKVVYTMGAPVLYNDFTPQSFKMPVEMNNDFRTRLAALADTFRNHPNTLIELVGYGATPKKIKTAKRLLQAIKTYFEVREGINPDRFFTKVLSLQKREEGEFEVRPYNPHLDE